MKISAYVHLNLLHAPTGVGNHAIEMITGLAAAGESVRLLAGKPTPAEREQLAHRPGLSSLPVTSLPFSRRFMEASWLASGLPAIDRWCEDADWLYLPMEAYVPSRRVPVAVTLHDMYALEPNLPASNTPGAIRLRNRWQWKFRKILPRARLLITVSEFSKRRLIELFDVNPDRIAVVGNGVAEAYFQPGSAPNNTGGDPAFAIPSAPYLFAPNGLQLRKGGKHLVDFAAALLDAHPEMKIVVTGTGPGLQQWNYAGSCSNIIGLGYVSTAQQISLLRGARAMLMLSTYEGFGIPALEAMAAGTPVIASNFTALPETVDNAGIVVDAANPAAVLDALKQTEHPETRTAFIARGRARADQFRWIHAVRKLIQALQSHA